LTRLVNFSLILQLHFGFHTLKLKTFSDLITDFIPKGHSPQLHIHYAGNQDTTTFSFCDISKICLTEGTHVEVEEEVETVAEAPLAESFGMYLVNPVLSSLC
jgi:hypothetical protein